MALLKGVTALCVAAPAGSSLAEWNRRVDADLLGRGWAKPGEGVVLLAGRPLGVQGAANTLAVHYVGDESSGFYKH